ncbi:hypothetical protein CA13_03520 [Planctomycetes bacterium CA13]|uniref:Uncharacterized protein n=1 Tax=Novipirellula herctigrandis TaxID=2527986 RepID=A0A5C5YVF1_9BACT|nr:hypothetical protein CA13_03520 [Planctomycetes bacterium CA13]
MVKIVLFAVIAIAASLSFSADHADAFGGRGYARRQARRAYYAPAPVVVQRVYVAPVMSYYHAPVYYPAPVSVNVGTHGSYYRSSYRGYGYPSYGGVSVQIGW